MPWSRTQIAERLAREFQDGWIVNLGVGMPTLITDVEMGEKEITFHAENGVIGFGPVAAEGQEDIHLVDASRRYVTLPPGAAIVDHSPVRGRPATGEAPHSTNLVAVFAECPTMNASSLRFCRVLSSPTPLRVWRIRAPAAPPQKAC